VKTFIADLESTHCTFIGKQCTLILSSVYTVGNGLNGLQACCDLPWRFAVVFSNVGKFCKKTKL
jgi:hypothetical protein